MHAAVAGCEAAAATHVATTELAACESAGTAKSTAAEVTAAAKAAGMASTKATAVTAAATMTTAAASTSSGEGVSLDRGRGRNDNRKNDYYFAQHQTLLLRTHLRPWMFSDTPRQPARSGRVANECGDQAFRVFARDCRGCSGVASIGFWYTIPQSAPAASMPDAEIRPPCALTMGREIDGPNPCRPNSSCRANGTGGGYPRTVADASG
jgi:hypothetical protein